MPEETPDSNLPPPIVMEGQQPQVFSPSPVPGAPPPQRRAEDTKSYAGEWTVLLIALLGWATTFMLDMAEFESWTQIWTPKFVGVHIGQLFSVTAAVIAAKRIR